MDILCLPDKVQFVGIGKSMEKILYACFGVEPNVVGAQNELKLSHSFRHFSQISTPPQARAVIFCGQVELASNTPSQQLQERKIEVSQQCPAEAKFLQFGPLPFCHTLKTADGCISLFEEQAFQPRKGAPANIFDSLVFDGIETEVQMLEIFPMHQPQLRHSCVREASLAKVDRADELPPCLCDQLDCD